MRRTTSSLLCVVIAAIGFGCGGGEGGPAPEASVRSWLAAAQRGDPAPLVESVDFREHYAALPAAERETTTFDAFTAAFRAAAARRILDAYVPEVSEHQVVGRYEDAGRTIVKVRFRRNPTTSWREWDLPLRRIDGRWRLGLGAIDVVAGGTSGTDTALAPPPRRVPRPVSPGELETVPDVVETPPPAPVPEGTEAPGDLPIPLPPPVEVPALPEGEDPGPRAGETPIPLPIPLPPAVEVPSTPVAPVEEPVGEAERAELARLRRFLAEGGDVDARLDDGQLLGHPAHGHRRLHVAAERGWSRVVRLLLEHGADPASVAMTKSHLNDVTPIDVARHAKHAEVAALLEQARKDDEAAVKTLRLVFPAPGRAGALVSLDEGSIRLVTEDMEGERVGEDLFVDPGDPEIQALTKAFDGLRHTGEDAAVAPIDRGFQGLRRAPRETPAWRRDLPRTDIHDGAVFLVRSSRGRLYKVQIQQVDERAVKLRFAPLPPAPPLR